MHKAGGLSGIYEQTPQMMHLHLSAEHPQLPWIAIFGMFLLNINYWCANQSVIQRSLAAKKSQGSPDWPDCRRFYEVFHGHSYHYARNCPISHPKRSRIGRP